MKTLSRRRWMSGLALAAAAGRPTRAGPSGPSGPGIVDAHAHVWSPDLHKYPLAPGLTREDLWFPSFTVEELVERGGRAGVTRYNLIQMTCYGLDHSYILDIIANDPTRFVGTGIVPAFSDVSLPGPDRTMKALARGGIYAFRIRGRSTRPVLGSGERWMDHPGFDKMFAAGARHDLCLSFLMTPADLPELDRMCRRHPETPVIIDHFCLIGKQADRTEEETRALCRMARHPRVMLKLGRVLRPGQEDSALPGHAPADPPAGGCVRTGPVHVGKRCSSADQKRTYLRGRRRRDPGPCRFPVAIGQAADPGGNRREVVLQAHSSRMNHASRKQ